jgi:hypothetical protein
MSSSTDTDSGDETWDHGQGSGDLVELDRDGCSRDMAQHLVVVVWTPGQTTNADDEFELLTVVRRVQVYFEELLVDVPHRAVSALAIRP